MVDIILYTDFQMLELVSINEQNEKNYFRYDNGQFSEQPIWESVE